MKIALLYLDVSNHGDLVIYQCSKYIIQSILEKHGIKDCELVPVDIGSFRVKQQGGRTVEAPPSRLAVFQKAIRKTTNILGLNPLTEAILRFTWHLSNTYQHYAANEREKLMDADLMVFCGGGMIKYHQQNFHYFIDDVTRIAQRRNVPVLMNSVGVEGYDEENVECQFLKRALNRPCMKFISTRDDIDTLRSCYVAKPDIVTARVCDPAFWTVEAFGITEPSPERGKVGLNVIRQKIFKQYMYAVSTTTLTQLYYELITKLVDAGYRVELFSNGVESDGKLIEAIFAAHPELREEKNLTTAYPATAQELVKTIATYERFMAVRLHASIVGTVLGIPNVSLVWNRKQILFGEQVGMPQNYITKEGFTADNVYRLLMDAKPYSMDTEYKQSVYTSLEEQLMKYLGCRENEEE